MQNFITLFLVLAPLFVGFAVPINQRLLKLSEQCLRYLVFVILLVIGIELANVQMLGFQLSHIIIHVLVLAMCTLGAGILGLMIFDKFCPFIYQGLADGANHKVSIRGSLLQVVCVVLGFLLGKVLPSAWQPHEQTTTGLLMLLIFLVGVGLKGSGIGLKSVLINRRGVQTSIIFVVSVWLGGVLYALLMSDVSIAKGLALSSGFGWYSLSAIIMTDSYGAIWGSIALFNDLIREFLALLLIPFFMRGYPSTAVGLGGATSLDFTLPVIEQSGGLQVVPLAISYGFIINVFAPIFMVGFSLLG